MTADADGRDLDAGASVAARDSRDAHRLEAAEVAAMLGGDVHRGLSAAEAAIRLARFGPNRLEAAEPVPAWRRLLAQLADPLVYLLLAAVVVSLVAWVLEGGKEAPFDAIVIAAIVAANAVLGYVQEARAEQAVAALQRMAAASAGVLRDGQELRIPAEDVVPGDLLLLAEGDAVAADGRLVEAASLTVAEASLTGESEPVLKDVAPIAGPADIGDRVNMVFSGTAVTRGRARAVVTATGMATETGNIAGLLARTEVQRTPLQREVDRIGRMLGIAVMVIAVVVVGAILLTSDIRTASELVAVLLIGVSLAVAAVPEGLPAVLSVVLALGVQRMATRRAIVKKLSSVETLGSASVICSDKTGTLTKSEMTVRTIVTGSGEVDITGSGYRPEGDLLSGGRPLDDPVLLDEIRALLTAGSLANDAVLRKEGDAWTIQGDPTEAAFLIAEAKVEGLAQARRARFERVGEVPFTADRKLMSTLHSDLAGELGLAVMTKGAPDALLNRCTDERVGGDVRPLTEIRRHEILAAVERLADLALRTLAVAYRPLPPGEKPPHDESIEHELVYLGLVGIIDPPRPEARTAIRDAHAAGLRVLMITGDHPHTAARIAADLGIASAGRRVMTGSELEALDDDARAVAVQEVSVYARVAPEHKLRIVEALHADGRIVAMTGDGVNDAPALKAADIGVAMGVAGTDVAKEAADMILADDNFATVVSAVREGRGIFANIRKFLRFLLSSNTGEVFTMFFGVVLAGAIGLENTGETIAAPLLATQILWINLLTDGAPALALGMDPPPDDVMSRPPRRPSDRVIDAGMWVGILWVGAVMATVTLVALDLRLPGGIVGDSGNVVEARTMAFTTLVLAQLFNCFNARSDRTSAFHRLFTNRFLWGAIALSALLQVAVVQLPFLNRAFDTTPLGGEEWLICVGLASLVLWADEAKKLLHRRLRRAVGGGGRSADPRWLHRQAGRTSVQFSDQLEAWLRSGEPKTLGALGGVFEEKGFAATILLLMVVPALPLPTGGITHVFEAITVVLAGEMVLGRRTIWLPERWQGRDLGATTTDRAIPFIIRWVRRVERFSRPRGSWLFEQGFMHRVLGLLFMALAATAAIAPPFSGLDTLPALGAIAIALAVILEDVVLLILGVLLGTSGVILIVTVGAAVVRVLRSLV